MAKISFTVEKTKTGFSAYTKQYPVSTTGRSMSDLKNNILDAVNTWFEFKGIKLASQKDLEIKLDLHQFFEFYKEINAKALSERIGMNQTLLSQYINGKKTPSEKQVEKILGGVKELGRELTQLEIV